MTTAQMERIDLQDVSEFLAAQEKLVQLQLDLTDVESEINEAHSTLGEDKVDRIDLEAQQLLDGGPPQDENAAEIDRERLEVLYRRRLVLYRAINCRGPSSQTPSHVRPP